MEQVCSVDTEKFEFEQRVESKLEKVLIFLGLSGLRGSTQKEQYFNWKLIYRQKT